MALHAHRLTSKSAPPLTELSGYRRSSAIVVAAGGALIVAGWLLPWGSAGVGDVSGLSASLEWWYRALVLGSACLAVAATALAGQRSSAWLAAAAAVVTTGWSLLFPAVVYVGARSIAGFTDAIANQGPSVSHGPGAYLLALGAVAVAVGSGPVATGRHGVWVATAALGAVLGSIMIVGLL